MKHGYSILLGETIEAPKLEYKDCEHFQIVCPACREPVFKGLRQAGGPDAIHYLSHYAATAAYEGDCELRVAAHAKQGFETQNKVARDQRLVYFLSVLRRTLAKYPSYAGKADKVHWQLGKAPGIQRMKDVSWDWERNTVTSAGERFDERIQDTLTLLSLERWQMGTTFSAEMQQRIARDMWLTILTPQGRSNYGYLFEHAFLDVLGSHMQHLDKTDPFESELVACLDALIDAKGAESNQILLRMRKPWTLTQRKHPTSLMDYAMQALQYGMARALLAMPYFELLKEQYGSKDKPLVYPSGYVRALEAEEPKPAGE